jgi:hypothetical protein
MTDLDWAEEDYFSGGASPTKIEPQAGVKSYGQLPNLANVSAQELNWFLHAMKTEIGQNYLAQLGDAMSIETTLYPQHATYCGGTWVVVGDNNSGSPLVEIVSRNEVSAAPTLAAGNITSLDASCAVDAVVLAGGPLSGATANKLYRSTNYGATFSLRAMAASDTDEVERLGLLGSTVWALLGASSLRAEYSTDGGSTWAAGSLSAGASTPPRQKIGDIATDGARVTVAASSGGTAVMLSTTDGITWTTYSHPASGSQGRSVAWTPKFGWISYCRQGATPPSQSADGITWAAATTATAPGSNIHDYVYALGNILVCRWRSSGNYYHISYSADGGASWERAGTHDTAIVGGGSGAAVGSGRLLQLGMDNITAVPNRVFVSPRIAPISLI